MRNATAAARARVFAAARKPRNWTRNSDRIRDAAPPAPVASVARPPSSPQPAPAAAVVPAEHTAWTPAPSRGARGAARLAALTAIHAAAADWTCALSDEGGDPYYYNAATKQSAWAQPPEHAALVAELDDLGDLMELCAGQVDPANCGAPVSYTHLTLPTKA